MTTQPITTPVWTFEELLGFMVNRGVVVPGVDDDVTLLGQRAFSRGDYLVLYENHAFDSSSLGHVVLVSYGSSEAQIERTECPQIPRTCPVDGYGWRYVLKAVCFGSTPQQVVLNAPEYTEVSYVYRDTTHNLMVRDLPVWVGQREPVRRMTNLDTGGEEFVDPNTDWLRDFEVTKLPDGFVQQ